VRIETLRYETVKQVGKIAMRIVAASCMRAEDGRALILESLRESLLSCSLRGMVVVGCREVQRTRISEILRDFPTD
jgi:hypothetical protein